MDSEQSIQNELWRTLIGGVRCYLLSIEANCAHFNAGIRLRSLCMPPVNTAPGFALSGTFRYFTIYVQHILGGGGGGISLKYQLLFV